MNPRTVCRCQPILSMISVSVARSSAEASQPHGPFCCLRAAQRSPRLSRPLWPWALSWQRWPSRSPCPWPARPWRPVGHIWRSYPPSALRPLPGLWMRSQIRLAAVLAFLNDFTGSTPGRLFQMADQPFCRQTGDQFRELLRVGEIIEGGGAGCGGVFCRAKRGNRVFVVNRKRRHNRSPWCHGLRGHHMNHSELLEKQGNSEQNRRNQARPHLAASSARRDRVDKTMRALTRRLQRLEATAALLDSSKREREFEEFRRGAEEYIRAAREYLGEPADSEFTISYRNQSEMTPVINQMLSYRVRSLRHYRLHMAKLTTRIERLETTRGHW